ncbi:MAG: glycosyltransferase family 9 protein [Candidatus Nitrohelix vancouverensis]|uniref:Glycosyltransferase family 9 protein n=1 Tax=Candidatus Nitrohelix vancouverensis TaxID=2705534 RepID=A0A7T0C3Y5_9BACT|nr:MAG: glycosyltransferase family 9 protein [Candidatus Nitrohelix vancouverensis]
MPESILVLTLTRIGDLVQATPLIAGLRKKYPEAKITQVVSSDFAEFAERIPHVDETIVFDLRQFKEKQEGTLWVNVYRYLENFMDSLKGRGFDLMVNLSHSKLSAFMNLYLDMKEFIGFACNETGDRMSRHPWMQYFGIEPFNRAYNPFNLVEIFTRSGDVDPGSEAIQILPQADDEASIQNLLEEHSIQEGELLIGVQAGSSIEGRRWPTRYFAELIDRLSSEMNARVLLFGVASESSLAKDIIDTVANKEKVVDLTGRTKINQLVAMLGKCRYLVTNDTGTMHIAAALGVRIVGLFFAHAHPWETGPFAPGNIIFQSRISCAPCSYGVECNNIICIHTVKPHHVFDAMQYHHVSGNWNVDRNNSEMNVYTTDFASDNRFRLRSLMRHALTMEDVFRELYFRLWPAVLSGQEVALQWEPGESPQEIFASEYQCDEADGLIHKLEEKKTALEQLMQLARNGSKSATRLLKKVSNRQLTNTGLMQFKDDFEALDKSIAGLGWSHPELKPVADMFSKRKENFQGDDIVQLARATQACYQQLEIESLELKRLVETVDLRSRNYFKEHSSMSVDVPGK